jgi:hypothetical protein
MEEEGTDMTQTWARQRRERRAAMASLSVVLSGLWTHLPGLALDATWVPEYKAEVR